MPWRLVDHPHPSEQALLDSAARRDVEAVAVHALADLGADEYVQQTSHQRLQDAGVRLLALVIPEGAGPCAVRRC